MTRYICILTFSVLLAACNSAATADTQTGGTSSTAPHVYFVSPQDGAEVTSPLKVTMASDNFTVEPAASGVHEGAGHMHIMVDADCIAAGQAIPKDDTHIHYGDGTLETELTLAPGTHTLCLQAANGDHVALADEGTRETITVTVQ